VNLLVAVFPEISFLLMGFVVEIRTFYFYSFVLTCILTG